MLCRTACYYWNTILCHNNILLLLLDPETPDGDIGYVAGVYCCVRAA